MAERRLRISLTEAEAKKLGVAEEPLDLVVRKGGPSGHVFVLYDHPKRALQPEPAVVISVRTDRVEWLCQAMREVVEEERSR